LLHNCEFGGRLAKDIKNSLCDILIVKQYKQMAHMSQSVTLIIATIVMRVMC